MSDNLKVIEQFCDMAKPFGFDLKRGHTQTFAYENTQQAFSLFASQQAAHEAEIARLKEENARQHKEILVYHKSRLALINEKEALAKQLSAANAACAMKDAALLRADTELSGDFKPEGSLRTQIRDAISDSPQQVSEWERKQLEPLLAQVAMLQALIKNMPRLIADSCFGNPPPEGQVSFKSAHICVLRCEHDHYQDTGVWLFKTGQATAEQFIAECKFAAIEHYDLLDEHEKAKYRLELRATSKKAG